MASILNCAKLVSLLIGVAALLDVTGCAPVSRPEIPPVLAVSSSQFLTAEEFSQLNADYWAAVKNRDSETALWCRWNVAARLLDDVEQVYQAYKWSVSRDRSAFDFGRDLSTLGFTAATALVGSAGTKTVLATASTAVQGATGAWDKNFYAEKTMSAIISQMQANHDRVLATIHQKLSKPDPYAYSPSDCRADAAILLEQSTVQEAINALSVSASVEAKKEQSFLVKIQGLQEATSSEADKSTQINHTYWKLLNVVKSAASTNTQKAQALTAASQWLTDAGIQVATPANPDSVFAQLRDAMRAATPGSPELDKLFSSMPK